MRNNKSGFGIAEVLMACVAIGGLSVLVTQLGKFSNLSSQKMKSANAFSSLSAQAIFIKADTQTWLNALRTTATLGWNPKACLPYGPPASTGPYNCPAAGGVTDKYVLALGGFASMVSLSNIQGVAISGTNANPIYYDGNGVICPNVPVNPKCQYMMTSFLVTSGNPAAGNPGTAQFVFKTQQVTPTTVNANTPPPMAPIYDVVSIPFSEWSIEPDPTCPAMVPGYFIGYNGGWKVCLQIPQCGGATPAFSGWTFNLASTPKTGTTNCAAIWPSSSGCAGVVIGINASGGAICGP